MAGCQELQSLEEFPPMDVRDASKKRPARATEFVESWFGKQGLAKDEQETSIYFGKQLSGEFMMPLKEKVDKRKLWKVNKAKLVAVEASDGERKRLSGAAAAAAETAIDRIQTEKNGKHLLPDDYATEAPIDTEDIPFITDLAKLLNKSEDWIEEQNQRFRKRAALSNRINDQFMQLQGRIRDKQISQGYVEAEGDYDADLAEVQEFSSYLWKKHNDFSGLV